MTILCALAICFALLNPVQTAAQSQTNLQVTLQKAESFEAANQQEKANEILTTFLEVHPENETALLKLGEVQMRQGLNEDAMKSFESVLRSHPNSQPARQGEVKAAEAEALADQRSGIDASALLCLIRARDVVPDSPELLFDFGMQAMRMRIFEDADAALTRAHTLAPKDAEILYALARVELNEQKMPEAEKDLRGYLEMKPADATAHYGLGHLLHMLMRNDEAKSELQRSIELKPRQTSSYYELGEIAREGGDSKTATKYYQKVLTLAPLHGGALTGMGILALREKDYALSEKYLRSAVANAPQYSTAHHYLAIVLARLGNDAEAKKEEATADALNQQETKDRRGNFLKVIH